MSKVEINSYQKLWKYENKIYKLGNLRMPFPINAYDALYFIGTLGVVILLRNIWPISAMNEVLKYGLIPYLISRYLRKVKFDGKTPIAFVRDFIPYFITKNQHYQFFQSIQKPFGNKHTKLNWRIGCRCWGGRY